jgi:hypothetical protein
MHCGRPTDSGAIRSANGGTGNCAGVIVFIGAILLSLLLSGSINLLQAQNFTSAYWRYDAPGRVNHLVVSDLNRDGIDEFVVVAGESSVVLVGSDGRIQWTSTYEAREPITHLATLNADDPLLPEQEVVVATSGQLALLSARGERLWERPLDGEPAHIVPITVGESDLAEILVVQKNGRLQLFNGEGQIIWRYLDETDLPAEAASPQIQIADLDRDGTQEIVFSYLTTGRYSKVIVITPGAVAAQWESSNNGLNTALAIAEFNPDGPLEIAVGTNRGEIYLYTADGSHRWPYRTPNKPVTTLGMAQLTEGPALIVGTTVGTVIAYDQQGRRFWSESYSATPDRPVTAISTTEGASPEARPASITIILGHQPGSTESADVLLLDDHGRRLEPSFLSADPAGLTRLVDINRDGNHELLLISFASMELLDPGIGAREYSAAWDYGLEAEPQSVLIGDIQGNGESELLVGTNDGKLTVLQRNGQLLWTADLGGVVSQVAIAETGPDSPPYVVAIHNNSNLDSDGIESFEGWIEVLNSDSRLVWNVSLPATISSMIVGDINLSGKSELIIGTTDGQVVAYSMNGDEFWRTSVNASVSRLLLVSGIRGTEIMVSSRANTIDRFNNKGGSFVRTAEFLNDINNLYLLQQDEELIPQLLVAVEDGTLRGVNARGVQIWEVDLDGLPTVSLLAEDSLLIATDEQDLFRIAFDGSIVGKTGDLGRITSLYFGDLDRDFRPDVAVGNRAGEIHLLPGDMVEPWGKLNLTSDVFYITAFQNTAGQQAELVAVTNTGKIQLFRSRPNRPPLLINPQTEVSQGQYTISTGVIDVENNTVTVFLDVFDPAQNDWVPQGDRRAATGNGILSWPITPPNNTESIHYRFRYDDGSHEGTVQPAPGPTAEIATPFFSGSLVILILALAGAVGAVLFIRQSTSPVAKVRRFYQKIRQQPAQTLVLLEEEYTQTSGSPDFLLNLANMARQDNDPVLSSLADGLFLLEARPDAALPIINGALQEAHHLKIAWQLLDIWQDTYRLGQALLTAPSVTELSLLRPQFVQLMNWREKIGNRPEPIQRLLPILTSSRDSERVDLADDRLVYLNEAAGLLKQLEQQSQHWLPHIENTLVKAIIDRWLGLIHADIEDLRGRAQLVMTLKTKRLVSQEQTVVALELLNVGRAPAEHIAVGLEASPTYHIHSPPQVIPFLPPAGKRQVQFTIRPTVREQFRVAFNVKYDDRNNLGKKQAFADMVHLLPPVLNFSPIINPYSPGTPLRRNSEVFFGREGLFEFICQNAGRVSQKNVLILVGQRRTGKTSALLHLDQHIPDNLFIVYVDCQSLGVVPGMAALFYDLAWVISDAFANKGQELPVPEMVEWQQDPGGMFQRHFLPAVRAMLPAETTVLLIFDEFEAFENLVNDGILPPTIFTYLRHLMQHADGISFIFAGTHRLEEMGTDYWSVLFNIALYRHVGFLNDAAATHLIRDPVSPHIIYDDLAVDKILRVTAGHPYFLQLVCYTLVNRANSRRTGYVTISDVNAALDEMLRLGEVHFAYLWQRSTYTEKALLAAVAHLIDADASFRPAELVQLLANYSIYLDPAEVTLGLNNLVEREIMQEVTEEATTLYELRIGLVGLWVAQNKSLSRLHDQRALQPESPATKPLNGPVLRPSGLPIGNK